jgi:translation initiation factor 3 subunit L
MADPTAFYEPEEDELLESLAVPAYGNNNDGEAYEGDEEEQQRRMQELEQHAFAQHEQEQMVALEMVPEDVKRVSARWW